MATTEFDVAIDLGRDLSDSEVLQVAQWIADAELLIRTRLGDLSLLDQDLLDYVVRQAVLSRTRNPDAFESETIDDYTYRHGSSSRQVSILDEWWELLNPSGESGAFTINPYPARRCVLDAERGW